MSEGHTYEGGLSDLFGKLWGDGFMTPGGERNLEMLFGNRDLTGQRLLDIGCGAGGPGLKLVEERGVALVGVDIEAALVEDARHRAKVRGLTHRAEFLVVTPGPFSFAGDATFDITLNNGGAFIHTEDKLSLMRECFRVLRPGGFITSYDWMTRDVAHSEDMKSVFAELEETFMLPLAQHGELLSQAGFVDIELTDDSDWYRNEVKEECRKMREDFYDNLCASVGKEEADALIKTWTGISRLCESGELRQTYFWAQKPR